MKIRLLNLSLLKILLDKYLSQTIIITFWCTILTRSVITSFLPNKYLPLHEKNGTIFKICKACFFYFLHARICERYIRLDNTNLGNSMRCGRIMVDIFINVHFAHDKSISSISFMQIRICNSHYIWYKCMLMRVLTSDIQT